MLNNHISVVIPAFNAEKYLRESVLSVLNQTLPPHEVIIVNDGSSDSTQNIVAQLTTEYSNVIYISQINRGLSAARNAGSAIATGSLIAYCDSDDIWGPNKLKNQIGHFISHAECLGVVSLYTTFSENSKKITYGEAPMFQITPLNLICGISWLPGSASSILIKKDSKTSQLKFDELLTYAEDLDMWIKLSKVGKICVLESNDIKIRLHDESMQTSFKSNPNSYLISVLEITNRFECSEVRRWLIERLFLWPICKEYIKGNGQIIEKIDWRAAVVSSQTLRLGKFGLFSSLLLSAILHSFRSFILFVGRILLDVKK